MTTTIRTVLEELPRAVAALDFARVQRCFHMNARLRALAPGRVREAESAATAAGIFVEWFGRATALTLVESSVDVVNGRYRLRYRMSGQEDDRSFAVEQTAYCDLVDDVVGAMDLLCSGFRFDDSSADGSPRVQDYDAGDLGCASGLPGELRRRLGAIAVGDQLRISTRDPSAREDLPALARMLGQRVLSVDRTDDSTIIILERAK